MRATAYEMTLPYVYCRVSGHPAKSASDFAVGTGCLLVHSMPKSFMPAIYRATAFKAVRCVGCSMSSADAPAIHSRSGLVESTRYRTMPTAVENG